MDESRGCVELLKSHDDYLILTHYNPDGDTLGSAGALCSALRRIGKTAYLYKNTQVTDKYLPFVERFFAPEGFAPKYVVSVDVASENQFPKGFEGTVDLCIDHHPSNTHYAKKYLVDGKKASCGEILLDKIVSLTGSLTPEEADMLYIAVSTDTGCFQYGNTNADTFRAAARLIEYGADNYGLNDMLFRKVSRERLKLEGLIYSALELRHNGRVAIATVTRDMLSKSGAKEDDLDDLANLCSRTRGADIFITIRQEEDELCHVSVRTTKKVNAGDICAVFGGGGHAMAAGCNISGGPERAKVLLMEVIDELLFK